MNNANQSIPIPKNPELDGVIVGIPQAESQIIWSFQSKAWYNKLIFLHDGMIFLEHQQKPVRFHRLQQNSAQHWVL